MKSITYPNNNFKVTNFKVIGIEVLYGYLDEGGVMSTWKLQPVTCEMCQRSAWTI